MANKIKCPMCNGCGKIEDPSIKNREDSVRLRVAAQRMREEGYTLRAIAKLLGFNHPQSIKELLTRKKP